MSGRYFFNPLIKSGFQKKDDLQIEITNPDGSKMTVTELFDKMFDSLNGKVDKFQGIESKGLILAVNEYGFIECKPLFSDANQPFSKEEKKKLENLPIEYGIDIVNATDGYLKSYQLYRMENGKKVFIDSKIDIPRDFFLKDVSTITVDTEHPVEGLVPGKYLKFDFVVEGGEIRVSYQKIDDIVAALKDGKHVHIDSNAAINAMNFVPEYTSFDDVPEDEKFIHYMGVSKDGKIHAFFYEKDETVIEKEPIIEIREETKVNTYTIPKGYNAAILHQGSNLIPPGIYLNDKTTRIESNYYSTFQNIENPKEYNSWLNVNYFDELYEKIGDEIYEGWSGTTTGQNYRKVKYYDKIAKRLYFEDGSVFRHMYDSKGTIRVYPAHRLNIDGSIDPQEFLLYQPGQAMCWFWKVLCKYNDGYSHGVADYLNNIERNYEWRPYNIDTKVDVTETTYIRTEIPQYEVITDWVQRDVQPRVSQDVTDVKERLSTLENEFEWSIIE